jgi:hypothetical protein
MEITVKIIEDMVKTFADELRKEGLDGGEIVGKAGDYLPQLQRIGGLAFQRWASFLEGRG